MHLVPDHQQRKLSTALRAALLGRTDDADVHRCLLDLDCHAVEPAAAMGLGLRYGTVICEELGRAGTGVGYLAAMLLHDLIAAGEPAEGSRVIEGTLTAALGYPLGRVTVADGLLDGYCRPHPTAADRLLVPATREGLPVLAVVDHPGDVGVAGAVELRAAPARAITPAVTAEPDHRLVRAWIRHAALLVGVAAGAHALAVRRAGERRQFDRMIGEQQAVSLPLAETYANLEAARLLVARAAWLSDAGGAPPEGSFTPSTPAGVTAAAAGALAYAAELALAATSTAVHVHGAFGVTRIAAVHRHYELAGVEALRWAHPAALWRVVDSLDTDTDTDTAN